ncbi:MAG: Stringent starvation protein B [Rhizobiales bacterium]|nr:Stringent starvation protein B [Hyphomicrobiales bacterium]
MADDYFRYDLKVQNALRGVVRDVLLEASENGLPGEHHFFISFKTDAPGVRISERFQEEYPDEMTIVLQHQFWGMKVEENEFQVELSFDNKSEKLRIPYAAITGFSDPSIKFGLQFDVTGANSDIESVETIEASSPVKNAEIEEDKRTADVLEQLLGDTPAPKKNPGALEKNTSGETATGETATGEVVQLDAFRKKN